MTQAEVTKKLFDMLDLPKKYYISESGCHIDEEGKRFAVACMDNKILAPHYLYLCNKYKKRLKRKIGIVEVKEILSFCGMCMSVYIYGGGLSSEYLKRFVILPDMKAEIYNYIASIASRDGAMTEDGYYCTKDKEFDEKLMEELQ